MFYFLEVLLVFFIFAQIQEYGGKDLYGTPYFWTILVAVIALEVVNHMEGYLSKRNKK